MNKNNLASRMKENYEERGRKYLLRRTPVIKNKQGHWERRSNITFIKSQRFLSFCDTLINPSNSSTLQMPTKIRRIKK